MAIGAINGQVRRINPTEQLEWVEIVLRLLKEKDYFLKLEKRMQNDPN